MTALTSLSLLGDELCMDKEDEGSDSEGEDGQLPPALRELARLPRLQRLTLSNVSGIAIEGQLLSLPPQLGSWPALQVLLQWSPLPSCVSTSLQALS